jgi:hypothetical protein
MALLTPQQIETLRQIIRDASTAVAISTTGLRVSSDELQRLVDEGYVDPQHIHDITLDAFELGRLLERLPEARDLSYTAALNRVAGAPFLSDAEQRAQQVASDRAGQYCVGLGSRYAGELTDEAIRLDAELDQRQRQGIRDEVSDHIARRSTLSELKSRLGRIAGDWARDWHRIASTESHAAHQQGFLSSVVARHGDSELLAKIPESTACADCKRLYLDASGRPKIRPASWWESQGASNAGLKRAEWKPVIGGVHPWCQCQLVRVPPGMVFDDEWNLVYPDDAEKSMRYGGVTGQQPGYDGRVGSMASRSPLKRSPYAATPIDEIQELIARHGKKKKKKNPARENSIRALKNIAGTLQHTKRDIGLDRVMTEPDRHAAENKAAILADQKHRAEFNRRLIIRPRDWKR